MLESVSRRRLCNARKASSAVLLAGATSRHRNRKTSCSLASSSASRFRRKEKGIGSCAMAFGRCADSIFTFLEAVY